MGDRRACVLPTPTMQEAAARLSGQIGHQTLEAVASGRDAGALGIQVDRFADERVHKSDPGVIFDDKEPSLVLRMELPVRLRRQIEPLKDEIRAGNEQGSGVGETPRTNWRAGGPASATATVPSTWSSRCRP
jgi:hypothetical protein